MSNMLNHRERTILLALMIREPTGHVTNRNLKEEYGLEIEHTARKNLVSREYLTAVRGPGAGKPFLHTLTEKGRLAAEDELSRTKDLPILFNGRVVYGLLNKVNEFLSRNHLDSVSVFGPRPTNTGTMEVDSGIVDEITNRYRELARHPGSWVMLRELREGLQHLKRGQIDDTLVKLFKGRRIHLIGESNQKTLTPNDRASCLTIAGDDKHLISIG